MRPLRACRRTKHLARHAPSDLAGFNHGAALGAFSCPDPHPQPCAAFPCPRCALSGLADGRNTSLAMLPPIWQASTMEQPLGRSVVLTPTPNRAPPSLAPDAPSPGLQTDETPRSPCSLRSGRLQPWSSPWGVQLS